MNERTSQSGLVILLVAISMMLGAFHSASAMPAALQLPSQPDRMSLEWGVQDDQFRMYLHDGFGANHLILSEDATLMHSALMQLSPNRRQVVFVTARDLGFRDAAIWLIGSDGADRHKILESGAGYWISSPQWSPDSQQILFVKVLEDVASESAGTQLWLYDLSQNRAKLLTADPAFAPVLIAGSAAGLTWDAERGLLYKDSQRGKLYSIDPTTGRFEESGEIPPAREGQTSIQACRGMVKPVPVRTYDGSIGNGYTTAYLDKYTYTSWEGYGSHPGVDIAGGGVGAGTTVSAAGAGHVERADWGGSWGNLVIIRHDGDGCEGTVFSIYAHMRDRPSVSGDISSNATIGYVGSTGNSTGAHLHFQIDKNNTSHPYWPSRSGQCTDCVWNSPNHVVNNPDTDNIVKDHTHSPMRFVQDRAGGGGTQPPQNCADGEGVVLYEHPNYQGRCSRFTGDDGNIGDNTIGNDAASSIKVIGNYEAQVFENGSYGGTSSRFTGDDPDFGNDAIGHDRASSIRVSRRDSGGTSNCDGGQGVELWEHSNFGGKCSRFTGDSPNPRSWYIGNDAASSIRFIGNYEATLYQHDEYNGANSTFTGDDADLSNNSIGNDSASSIRVRVRQSGGTSNCDGGNGVYLYQHSNYDGRCTKLTADAANPSGWYVGNDAASSIRFFGNYAATVYEHDNYNGTSSSFEVNDPDFGNDAIGHDRVSSVRVRIRDSGPSSCSDNQFLAEYFSNRSLTGSPLFRRCEASVNYDWGGGGPGNGIPNDNFSVRWTGRFWFANDGVYRFTTRTDDGVRLWVDSVTLMQEWRDMGATTFQRDQQLNAGMHTVRMEYYENGGAAVAQLGWQLQSSSANDPDDGRTLSYGFGHDGTINPARDRDDYYFDGSSGQAITLRMDKRDSGIDSYLELYNPDGSLLGQDDDNGGNRNARLAITLRQNGRHKVIAREYSTGTGGYRVSLSLESVADPDDNRWIAFGNTLQGTISPNNDRDTYYFSGTAGRSVSIQMRKLDAGLDSYLELYNPAGVKVMEDDDGLGDRNSWVVYMLPTSGTYRIMARSYGLSSSGRYNLSITSVSNANLAQGKSVGVSSVEFSGVEGWRATDGSTSTRWSSRFSDPGWIYVDLGQDRTFNQVVLKWETAYGKRFGIYYMPSSACSNCWTNVYWTDSGRGGTNTINFNPVRGRYVLMWGVERGTQYGYSLWEFEIYDNTALVLPIVPPGPGDKPPEEVEQVAPLAPNDPDKETLLLGEGEAGQEETPLAGDSPASATAEGQAGTPSAFILYPNSPDVTEELILFQGIAEDNDEDGQSIEEYRWTSSLDGVIGTTSIFTMLPTDLSRGRHVITFEVRDDEGVWSGPVSTEIVIEGGNTHRLYLPLVQRTQ